MNVQLIFVMVKNVAGHDQSRGAREQSDEASFNSWDPNLNRLLHAVWGAGLRCIRRRVSGEFPNRFRILRAALAGVHRESFHRDSSLRSVPGLLPANIRGGGGVEPEEMGWEQVHQRGVQTMRRIQAEHVQADLEKLLRGVRDVRGDAAPLLQRLRRAARCDVVLATHRVLPH